MNNTLNRRTFVKASAIGTFTISTGAMLTSRSSVGMPRGQESADYFVYVGTYAPADAEGIFQFDYNSKTGNLTKIKGFVGGGANNSFLAISPNQQYLFSVSEDGSGGQLASFKIDSETGDLTYINSTSSEGRGPCYVTTDKTGKWLLAANYGSGNVCIVPIAEDGSLQAATDAQQHEGSSVNERRQNGPHAHAIMVDSNNQFVYAPDLGIDKIMIYKLDAKNGKLIPNDPPYVETPPGAGPRHFAFHPNQQNAYGIMELSCDVIAYDYDATTGALTQKQVIPTLPDDFEGNNTCADIHVTPVGKFLYASNRGHDSLAIYSIADDGTLTLVGHQSTHGETPRNFNLDSNYVIAANQNTDSIVVLKRDHNTGLLTKLEGEHTVPKPVCIKFFKK